MPTNDEHAAGHAERERVRGSDLFVGHQPTADEAKRCEDQGNERDAENASDQDPAQDHPLRPTRLWSSLSKDPRQPVLGAGSVYRNAGWRCGVKVYAFDVDHTLELSAGPVRLADVVKLREDGHIIGICGNWGAVTRVVGGWHNLFSFIGPIGSTKADMLVQLATYIPAEEHIMVGNDPNVFGQSADSGAAAQAGWRFIREEAFARGAR
jgi:hypothetical protein